MPTEDVFPTLTDCARLFQGDQTLFDVKFFPYATEGDENIFAVTGEKDVFIFRTKEHADPPYELLGWYKDAYNSLVWTIDPTTQRPLICLAGSSPKQIKILDALTGKPLRTLPGHGKGINDLAISPLSTNILASASEDYTIRLWDLRPQFESQPCVAMFSGEGHKQPTLSIHFHPNGRWLLSGGLDTAVCLWAVPDLDQLDKPEDEINQHTNPTVIYYPHFMSTEVHHNYVDCLHFYGDLIFSRACRDQNAKPENEILLWKIDGFDHDEPPPADPPIPGPTTYTRSSFPHSPRSRGFQRLLSFSIPYTDRFYHRFGLLHQPGMRPILSMGNQNSTFLFWDLQKLEEGWDPAEEKKKGRGRAGKKAKQNVSSENLNRLGSVRSESVASDSKSTGGGATPKLSSTSISTPLTAPERKFALSDPFTPIKAHFSVTPKTKLCRNARGLDEHFATSQMAWSPDGKWLVACGDKGVVCLFHRDRAA
ncbi:uncharacterized protein LTR77_007801 [Saxophila tyrrhenica]|uniref:WD40 repeat-like protein n=1 Tax=Saxophila tyrrhenica TaxID=1690608 RepID=A0AAV9P3J4_9PEZI|nr:hypothetical protein LTR77_007801 [Saxophila tyrrhenica]